MSEFKFVASSHSISEIDRTGIQYLQVKDMIRMNVKPGWIPWTDLDPEAKVMFSEDPDALKHLSIKGCGKPPEEVWDYIRLNHLYWLEGELDSYAGSELIEYINDLSDGLQVELWSIWVGNGHQVINRLTVEKKALSAEHLKIFEEGNCCIAILNSSQSGV